MYQKTILNNGLRIVSSNMPHVRSVSVCVFIGAGSRYESDRQAGVSHFVEHLLFKGTQRRPEAKDISEAIEGVGGILNAATDKEVTVYWAKAARSHLELVFDVLGDMICCSSFDPEEVEKERQVVIEEINMSMDSPQQRVGMLIDEAIWPNQALGRDVAGSKETVTAISRQAVLDYHKRQYTPDNMVVSVAGDVSHDEVVALSEAIFGELPAGNPAPWLPARDQQDAPRYSSESRETEQLHLCLALRGLSSVHPDRYAFDLVNVVLGGGMSGRLFLELRERLGLVYDVHSYVNHFLDSGALTVYSGVEPKHVEATIEVILKQLDILKREAVSPTELTKVREMAKGRLLLGMEDSRSVSGWIGSQELLNREIKTIDDMTAIIDGITIDDMKRVAQEYFTTNNLSLAIVGPVPDEGQIRRLLTF